MAGLPLPQSEAPNETIPIKYQGLPKKNLKVNIQKLDNSPCGFQIVYYNQFPMEKLNGC
jgi:hypothetical protein